MTKKNRTILVVTAIVLILALSVTLGILVGRKKGGQEQQTAGTAETRDKGTVETADPQNTDPTGQTAPQEPQDHSVLVKNQKEEPLAGINVWIYTDDTLSEVVWMDTTSEAGSITFSAVPSESYVAQLRDVPEGYVVDKSYPLTGLETQIVLLTEEEVPAYQVGDEIRDFTVTDPAGKSYTASKLLQEKQAIVLIFWDDSEASLTQMSYLQTAYLKYREQIEVLGIHTAMDGESIEQFRTAHGLVYPLVQGDPMWESWMALSQYPTVAVIDREGKITLIRTEPFASEEDVIRIFDFVTAEDYTSGVIEDISKLPEVEAEAVGTVENPQEIGGVSSFQVTVKPGEQIYVRMYKYQEVWIQINDSTAYVIYDETKYEASGGSVGFLFSVSDTFSGTDLIFGNSGTETKTYTVYLSALPGSAQNAYTLKLGQFTVSISAGNDSGVYYSYTPTEDGKLTIQCLKAPAGVDYDCTVDRILANDVVIQRSLSADGENRSVTVEVKKGERVKVVFGTLPDSNNNYPGGTFTYQASFAAGEVQSPVIDTVKKADYTVKVTDDSGKAVQGVSVTFTDGTNTARATSDSSGVATASLAVGNYTATVRVPTGYTLSTTQYSLTEAAPSVTVKLTKLVVKLVTYTVTVNYPDGTPAAAVTVLIGGTTVTTDTNGRALFSLAAGDYTAYLSVPTGYVFEEGSVALTEAAPSGTATLAYALGTEQNPDTLQVPADSVTLNRNETRFYRVSNVNGWTMTLTGEGVDVTVGHNGTEHTTAEGTVSVELVCASTFEPALVKLTNNTAERAKCDIAFTAPLGDSANPAQMVIGENTAQIQAGDSDGWFFTWTADQYGDLTLTMPEGDWIYSVGNTTSLVYTDTHWSDDETVIASETLLVRPGDVIQVNVNNYDPANMFSTPGGDLTFTASFLPVIPLYKVLDTIPGTIVEEADALVDMYDVAGATLEFYGDYFYVEYGGRIYEPERIGLSLTVTADDPDAPVRMRIVNFSERYPVEIVAIYPLGHKHNPQVLTAVDTVTTTLKSGDNDGYYYTWTADRTGTLKLTLDSVTDGTACDVTLTNGEKRYCMTDNGDGTVSVVAYAGDVISIHVSSLGEHPATTVVLTGSFAEGVTQEPGTEPEEPEEPEIEAPDESVQVDYLVTVTDFDGNPIQGVTTQILWQNESKGIGTTDQYGEVSWTLASGTYQVNLAFPAGTSYHYDTNAAVLTPAKPEVVIAVTGQLAGEKVFNGMLETDMERVSLGGTYVTMQADLVNYYIFTPQEQGTYRFTTSDPGAVISYWLTPNFPLDNTQGLIEKGTYANNAFTLSVSESQLGGEHVIGITGASETILIVTRIGDAQFDVAELPWTVYELSKEPAAVTVSVSSGKTLTYVDLQASTGTYKLVYSETDGYYHIGSATGPVLYVNLGADARYVSLDIMINGDGVAGGAPFRKYFYDELGNFIKKEDYTEAMSLYIAAADPTLGLYPVDKELAYMLQNGTEAMGWGDPNDPSYLFTDLSKLNTELAWMFACCYFA